MTIKKVALIESFIGDDHWVPFSKVASVSADTDKVVARFRKVADQLREEQAKASGKQLSPKVDDFLYAHCIMMHAAEASLINQETGEVLLNKAGSPVEGGFVPFKDAKGHDSVKWESPDGILPYRNCFVSGTQVLMSNGTTKSIEDVEVGDQVVSHKGNFCTVLNNIKNTSPHGIYKISVRNGQDIYSTGEHPFYVSNLPNGYSKPKYFFDSNGEFKGNFEWKTARNISKSDKLLTPRLKQKSGNLSSEQSRLLGLFAAEGSFKKKYGRRQSVVFTFAYNEANTLGQETLDLARKVFNDAVSSKLYSLKDRSVCEVILSGQGISDWFYNLVGECSREKTLDKSIVFGSDESKLSYLGGWLDGDGCREKSSGKVIGITTSKNLSSQTSVMLNSLGIAHSVYKTYDQHARVINPKYGAYASNGPTFRVEICNSEAVKLKKYIKRFDWSPRPSRKQNRVSENYILNTVKSASLTRERKEVYNLTVDGDNSFIANGYAVHNCNGDIFPEEDLVQAHKEWVGKPLCRDHVSGSVDGIRGIIIDTYYDPTFKRVHALFALDRKNYGELARKVEAGYATSVSMGTAVGRSICSECSNVATVESEYCHHVRSKTCHGEVNKDLSPIELSIVVTGADPKAKIMTVLAQLEDYQKQVDRVAAGNEDQSVLDDIMSDLSNIEAGLYVKGQGDAGEDRLVNDVVRAISILGNKNDEPTKDKAVQTINNLLSRAGKSLNSLSQEGRTRILQAAASKGIDMGDDIVMQTLEGFLSEPQGDVGTSVQSGSVSREVIPTNELVDSNGYGLEGPDLGLGNISQGPNGVAISASKEEKNENKQGANLNLANKIASMKEQILSLEKELSRENVMTFAELKKKRQERKAYWQGTEEPTPGKPQYELMGDQDKIRDNEDKQMNQTGDLGGPDGLVPGDEQTKKMVQRAKLEERMARRAEWLKEAQDKTAGVETFEEKSTGKTRAINTDTGQVMADDGKTAGKKDEDGKDSEDDKKSEKKDDKKDDKDSKDDKKDDKKSDDKEDKKDEKGSKDDDDKKSDEKDDKKDGKDDKDDKKKSEAYYQGTEEPTPGKPQYDKMGPPDQDQLREKDDKHMLQTGDLGGSDGLVPGDEQVKREMQRMASLGGKLLTHASGDKSKSKWVFTRGDDTLFSVTASEAYGDFLNDKFTGESTFADLFHSKDWGNNVRKMVNELGLEKAAEKLGAKLAAEPALPAEPAPEPAPMDEPAGEPELPDMSEMDEEPAGEDDLKSRIGPVIEQLETALEDLKVEVEGPEEGVKGLDVEKAPEPDLSPDLNAPVGEPGMGELAGAGAEALASVTDKDMLEAYAFISDTANELCYIEAKLDEKKVDGKFTSVAEQALHDAQAALEDTKKLIASYASQKKAVKLAERAKAREKLVAEAMGMTDLDMADDHSAEHMASDHGYAEHMALDAEEKAQVEELAHELDVEHHGGEAELAAEKHEDDTEDLQYSMDYAAYDNMSAEARKAWRQSLVKSAGQYDDVYEGERSSGGHTLENLDVSVKDNLDKVETLHETHQVMEDVATKPLGKVREAAEKLNKWVKAAKIDEKAVERLVAEGAVDAEVAKYWKEYWGQAGEKAYAEGLLKDYDNQKKSASNEANQVRIRRAYALGIEAQKKGIVDQGQASLDQYVDTLVSLNEEQFNGLKKHVAMYKAPQKLTSAPLVGINNQENVTVEKTASSADPFADLLHLFD